MAALAAEGKQADVLLWVGCAGAFDQRYQKVMRSFAKLLEMAHISFATLGEEESCTGDPARRAGNEFLFQMQAQMNIDVLNGYEVKKIVAACPHCFNTFKNEYPALGGSYEVLHHSEFLQQLIEEGKITPGDSFSGQKVTFHDPCYLGRINGEYENPRKLIDSLKADITEMERNKKKSFCCGAGGAQLFKEAEKGNEEVHYNRTKEALDTGAKTIAVGCPFCMTMMTDGTKHHGREDVQVVDLAEMILQSQQKEK